jgi:hypothetical protein
MNFASFGPFWFAINLAIAQPDGFVAVFESQLKPTTGILYPFAINDNLVLSSCSLAPACPVHTPWMYIANSLLSGQDFPSNPGTLE